MDDKNINNGKIKENTNKYKENKLRYIPKADIEMLREEIYESSGNKKQKKFK